MNSNTTTAPLGASINNVALDKESGREIALACDISSGLGIHQNTIRLAALRGQIGRFGRFYDVADAVAWDATRSRKVGRPRNEEEDPEAGAMSPDEHEAAANAVDPYFHAPNGRP